MFLKKYHQAKKLHQLYLNLDNIAKQTLSNEDVNNLATLYIDPKYKSLVKLLDNVIIDLENKSFKEAESKAEFLAIKWTRAVLFLIKNEIKNKFDLITTPKNAKGNRKTATTPEDFEKLPDGVPLNP